MDLRSATCNANCLQANNDLEVYQQIFSLIQDAGVINEKEDFKLVVSVSLCVKIPQCVIYKIEYHRD